MGMLDELLRLKEYREDKAETAVSAGRMALAQAVRHEEKADASLTEYRQWSEDHERYLYAELCLRVVRTRDLDRLHEDVGALRVKEGELAQLLMTSGKQRVTAEQSLKQARSAHDLATRAREKFVQLVSAEAIELRLEGERKEDVETEDLYALKRDRGDWGEQDDEDT